MSVMNVLVLGVSGAGKSTLIKAISGKYVERGAGESNTKEIGIYDSNIWPIRCIDTKGFEYNFLEQIRTIGQIRKFTKNEIKKDVSDSGLDAVWYCIEGTSRRTFKNNIELMKKAIKGWKNIPIFIVLTKSYSEIDIDENISVVKKMVENDSSLNIKGVIPVVAEEYKISDEVVVSPMNLDELCLKTLEIKEEAKLINKDNRVLEQKRFSANNIVIAATFSAALIGTVPIPFPDSLILVRLETGLTKRIFKIYGVEFSSELVTMIVGSTAITTVAKSIIKVVPVAGPVVNGVIAGVIVYALGEAVIQASNAMYLGKLDTKKLDETVDYITDKVKENKIIETTTKYLEDNIDKLENKKPKEILNDILRKIKK